MRLTSLLLLVTGLMVIAGCQGDGGENYGPTVSSLSEALEQARSTERNVLVIYASASCPWSRTFQRDTLGDEDVRGALGAFVVLRIEQGENSEEFEKVWGKQPTPSVVTLDADGKPLGTMLNGVVRKSDFLAYAIWAKTGAGPQPAIAAGGG